MTEAEERETVDATAIDANPLAAGGGGCEAERAEYLGSSGVATVAQDLRRLEADGRRKNRLVIGKARPPDVARPGVRELGRVAGRPASYEAEVYARLVPFALDRGRRAAHKLRVLPRLALLLCLVLGCFQDGRHKRTRVERLPLAGSVVNAMPSRGLGNPRVGVVVEAARGCMVLEQQHVPRHLENARQHAHRHVRRFARFVVHKAWRAHARAEHVRQPYAVATASRVA